MAAKSATQTKRGFMTSSMPQHPANSYEAALQKPVLTKDSRQSQPSLNATSSAKAFQEPSMVHTSSKLPPNGASSLSSQG